MRQQFVLFLILILLISSNQLAQWTKDLTQNLPICIQNDEQITPLIISDGDGGAIIVWADKRDGDYDLYAQKVTNIGQKVWQENGIAVFQNRGDLLDHQIVTNGNGGAYIIWTSNDRIYSQQIDASGNLIWPQPVGVSTLTESQHSYSVAPTFDNGFIISFISGPISSWNQLIVQRLNSNGDLVWGESGRVIIDHTNSRNPEIAPSSNGGAFIFYELGWVNYEYYVQVIDENGYAALNADGTLIGPYDGRHDLISDGTDGAIIVWEADYEIFVNRIDASGNKSWSENNVVVCAAATEKSDPHIISDNNNGAFIAWYDATSLYNDINDIYAQHINISGQRLWGSDGVLIASGEERECLWNFSLQTNNKNDLIVTWESNPNDRTYLEDSSKCVLVQKISPSGNTFWTGGQRVSTNPASKCSAAATSDDQGNIITVWADKRNGDYDIYAQRIDDNIIIGLEENYTETIPFDFSLSQNYPNPFNPNTTIGYSIPGYGFVTLKLYDVLGHEITTLVSEQKQPGNYRVDFNGANLSSGVYFYKLQSGDRVINKKMLLIK